MQTGDRYSAEGDDKPDITLTSRGFQTLGETFFATFTLLGADFNLTVTPQGLADAGYELAEAGAGDPPPWIFPTALAVEPEPLEPVEDTGDMALPFDE